MSFLDPVEATRISELLESNQPVAAAELLARSKNRLHRSMRPLVTQCVGQLADAAARLFKEGCHDAASRHICLASDLRPLSGEHAALQGAIESAIVECNQRIAHEKALVSEANHLANSGRYQTAIERIESITDNPAANRLLSELEAKIKTVQRQIDECGRLLSAGNERGAAIIFQKIKDACPSGAAVQELDGELGKHRTDTSRAPQIYSLNMPRPVVPSDRGVILDFGCPARNTAILFGSTFVIGGANPGASVADIPITGHLLHRQHAVLLQHQRAGQTRYWLMSHPSHSKYTAVTRQRNPTCPQILSSSSTGDNGAVELEDGDTIAMGRDSTSPTLQLVFRLQGKQPEGAPSAEGGSAMLEVISSSKQGQNSALAKAEFNRAQCRRIGLFSQCFQLEYETATLNIPDLPVPRRSLLLQFSDGCLRADASQTLLLSDDDFGGEYDDNLIRYNTVIRVAEFGDSDMQEIYSKHCTLPSCRVLPVGSRG